MGKVAEKVGRMTPEAYDFVAKFSLEHDLRFSEGLSLLIGFCAKKNLKLTQREVEVVELENSVEEV